MSNYDKRLEAMRELSVLIEQYGHEFATDERLARIKDISLSWSDELAQYPEQQHEDFLILSQLKTMTCSSAETKSAESEGQS